jgi:hypothetical protein
MTRLRIASLFVAVVAGDYAALMLIDGQLIDFGVTAAICAGSFGAAGLIAYADRRRRTALARGRAAVWERRDQQAAAADEQRYAWARAKNQVTQPNPRVPTRRADDPRSHPLTKRDRPLHPRSDRITEGP